MKRLNLNSYAALLVLIALLSGCSGSVEKTETSNTSAQPQQANSNSAEQPKTAQGNPPVEAPTPLALPPVSPPAANSKASGANPMSSGNVRAPKLVAPEKKIDYGKVPQDKTLIRAIAIKNGGLADLNIESVVPS